MLSLFLFGFEVLKPMLQVLYLVLTRNEKIHVSVLKSHAL